MCSIDGDGGASAFASLPEARGKPRGRVLLTAVGLAASSGATAFAFVGAPAAATTPATLAGTAAVATTAPHATSQRVFLRRASEGGSDAGASGSTWAGLAAVGACLGRTLLHERGQRRHQPRSSRLVAARAAASDVAVPPMTTLPKVDRSTTKQLRKDLMRSDQYFRFSKTQMNEAAETLRGKSGSDLISRIRKNGNRLTIGDITFVLAESYGFCWGVERTLSMAYEARKFFPDKTIWLTNEIIHNAVVNKDLAAMGMKFVTQDKNGLKDYSGIQEGDVVLLPAFGASIDEMAYMKERNVHIVDTTCPWVSKVWNTVEKTKGKGHTVIIHGKAKHEETIATSSFANDYIVIKDMTEAEYLANYMLEGGDRDEFLNKFKGAMSDGFDPDVHLKRVGVANQTTMLKGETALIAKLFERVIIKKYGPQNVNDHFISFNTICDATQERQDAMYKMFGAEYEAPTSELYNELEGEQGGLQLMSGKENGKLSSKAAEDALRGSSGESMEPTASGSVNLVLCVGGYNSSNTTHLIEIPLEEGIPAYHVDRAVRIGGVQDGVVRNVIQHKPLSTSPHEAMAERGLEVTEGFLPDGPVVIGVTSGASTPDNSLGDCLERVLAIRGLRA